ncbi:MAG: hypothetical protein HYT39_02500 [Candidatus Sungbacteria bacterium]|nr:hypothetical protein [Candidatus Sungbacteria bacterium]
MEKVVYLDPIKVVYTNSFGDPSHSNAFVKLEAVVPLRGNKFYATYNSETGEYCACAKIENEEQAKVFNLPVKTLEGGWYAAAELEGSFRDIVRNIAPTFADLAKNYKTDPARLPIEFYKRHTHVILYMPIIKES